MNNMPLLIALVFIAGCQNNPNSRMEEKTQEQERAPIRRDFFGYRLGVATEKELRARCKQCNYLSRSAQIIFSDKDQKENGGIAYAEFSFTHGKLEIVTLGYDMLLSDFDAAVAAATKKFGPPVQGSTSWIQKGTILAIEKREQKNSATDAMLGRPPVGYTMSYSDIGLAHKSSSEKEAADAARRKKQADEM
jgi:hypothetical protein